jgi:hypothetical protein|nr:MAG TPA: RecT protein [Caudoviricetes sp.]
MNEIQKQNPVGVVTTTNPMNAGFNFFDPVQFETMQRVCKMFASSDLVPDNYKPIFKQVPANANPEQIAAIQLENQAAQNKAVANCMIAIEISMRIGASPLMVMQNMVPIYGKPSWSSKFLIATVNSCGRFEPLQYRFTNKGMLGMVDYTDYVWDSRSNRKQAVQKQFDGKAIQDIECVAYTTKKASKEVLESSPVSVRLAIQEGWFTKNGSKWQTMTKQMLMYRAASWWTSVYAPDLSMGMRTIEEQQDIVDVDYQEVIESPEEERRNNANKETISADIEENGTQSPKQAPRSTEAENVNKDTMEAAKEEHKPNPGF